MSRHERSHASLAERGRRSQHTQPEVTLFSYKGPGNRTRRVPGVVMGDAETRAVMRTINHHAAKAPRFF